MTATVTVSDTFEGFDSSKQTGYVAFTGPAFVKDHTGENIRVGTTKVPLDANGHFTVDLLATDAPGIEPSGWTYSVVVKIGRSINPFSIWLPAANTNVNFRDLAPVASTSGVLAMVPVVESVNGVPPDAAGNVELDTVTSADLATETAMRQGGDAANTNAIANETLRAVGREDAVQAAAQTYTDSQITALKGAAGPALDTLAEIDAQIAADEGSAAALAANVAAKATGRVGPTDPAPTLTPGTEYVWFQTDGAGTLLDILTGVA